MSNRKKRKNPLRLLGISLIFMCIVVLAGVVVHEHSVVSKSPNAISALELESAYGDTQAIHPKVIAFDKQWNGYSYWIAFSPYPYGDDAKENPHILASNDLENWECPDGFVNPLDECPENYVENVCYNSDPCLLYNQDKDELECWWRYVDDINDQVILFRRCSKDGVNWNDKEEVLVSTRSKQDYVSPCILYEDGLYKMWSVGSGYKVQYIESENLTDWSDLKFIDMQYRTPTLKTWHLDVIHTPKGYEMIIVAFDSSIKKGSHLQMNLYYSYSKDNVAYEQARTILKPSSGEAWDNRGIYKSCLLFDKNEYYIFYTGIRKNDERGVGLISWNQKFLD